MRNLISILVCLVALTTLGTELQADLVSHYTFDTDASDAQGLRNGTLTPGGGTAAITTTAGEFKVGAGALNVGGGGYVDLPGGAAALNGLTTWTLGAWVKIDALNGNSPVTNQAIFTMDEIAGTSFHAYWAFPGGTNTLEAQTFGGVAVSSTDIPGVGDGWFHYAAVRNGAVIDLYLNGQPLASAGLSSASTNLGNDAAIGTWADRFLVGQIDDLRIYNDAQTAAQIQAWAGIVPEPCTLFLLTAGGIILRTWKKQRG